MGDLATQAADNLLSSGDVGISALLILAIVLLYLLITEKRDHRSTRDDLKDSNADVLSLSERALTAIAQLRESIQDFMRR